MCNLTIDINSFCPLRCEFCYQNLDNKVLSEEKIYEIVDDNPKFEIVELGGGEPFVDPRIIRILKNLRARKKSVHVSTSGVSIPQELFSLEDEVKKGIQIQFSIHYSTPELFKKITQRDRNDLFERIFENLERVKTQFTTVISTTVYQENIDDIPNIIERAYSAGIPIRINPAFPIGSGKNVQLLTPYQLDQLRGYLLVQRVMKKQMVESPLIHRNNCAAITNAYGIPKEGICPIDCAQKIYVSPRGKITKCEFVEKIV